MQFTLLHYNYHWNFVHFWFRLTYMHWPIVVIVWELKTIHFLNSLTICQHYKISLLHKHRMVWMRTSDIILNFNFANFPLCKHKTMCKNVHFENIVNFWHVLYDPWLHSVFFISNKLETGQIFGKSKQLTGHFLKN